MGASAGSAGASFPGRNGRIAFDEDVAGHGYPSLFSVASSGQGLRRIAGTPATAPAWSADGRQLAFSSEAGNTFGALFVSRADGANARKIAAPCGRARAGTCGNVLADPTWAPDGRRLAFIKLIGDCAGPPGLVSGCHPSSAGDVGYALEVINRDGTHRHTLLIRQLVIDSGNTPQRGTQFPIYANRAAYVEKRQGRLSARHRTLRGVASRHRSVVDEFQPYQRGRRAQDDPLAILQTVSNRDKHNDIYTALAAVRNPRCKLVRAGMEDAYIEFGAPNAMADGDLLLSFTYTLPPGAPPDSPMPPMHLEVLDMDVELGFMSDRLVALADIERSVLAVSGIVDRFAARISK